MAVVLAEYEGMVVGPKGHAFRARACALPTRQGGWHGWIEFDPIDGAPRFRSPHETTQTTRSGVVTWASSLTPYHLECALDRALGRLRGTPSAFCHDQLLDHHPDFAHRRGLLSVDQCDANTIGSSREVL